MKIHFLGAAREVTGSKHIVEVAGQKILLDCGLFQGHRQKSFEKNRKMPFNPSELNAVILSHAHMDHSGGMPLLTKHGYTGKIYCTHATKDIVGVMLEDSAHIQQADAEYFARKLSSTALKMEPLYNQEDVLEIIPHFVGKDLHQEFKVTENISAIFYDAGHVLGSAITELRIKENGQTHKLIFTGDLGRENRDILEDPEQIPTGDILITESTYGGRFHPDIEENRQDFVRIVKETIAKGGKLIIPSFSLERTQEVIFNLNLFVKKDKIPQIPVYIDSPLSTKITKVFAKHPECYDEEVRREFLDEGHDPFDNVRFTKTVEESKAINNHQGPCIVISASGMCEAGRIRHHLRNSVEDPRNTILIVGYQAEHTLGRRIVEKRKFIKIFDEMYALKANVEILNGFSGHADRHDLLNFAKGINGLKNVFIVHGEESQSLKLQDGLQKELGNNVKIMVPQELETIEV